MNIAKETFDSLSLPEFQETAGWESTDEKNVINVSNRIVEFNGMACSYTRQICDLIKECGCCQTLDRMGLMFY